MKLHVTTQHIFPSPPFFFFLPYFDVKELKHISVLDALEQQKLWF